MADKTLSPDEEMVMRATFKAAMLRAADIIENITEDDVLTLQAQMLRDGVKLDVVARIDRAMVACAHLRACAAGNPNTGKLEI